LKVSLKSLTFLSSFMLNVENINPAFERALKNEGIRQEFVDSIDFREYFRYIESVVYDPDYAEYVKRTGDWRIVGYYMITTTGSRAINLADSLGKKSTIYISKRAFDDFRISNGVDFYTSLVDHEGQHAKDYFEGIEIEGIPVVTSIDARFILSLLESRAYGCELHLIKEGKRKVSWAYSEHTKDQYSWYTWLLPSYAKNDTEKRVAEIMLEKWRESTKVESKV